MPGKPVPVQYLIAALLAGLVFTAALRAASPDNSPGIFIPTLKGTVVGHSEVSRLQTSGQGTTLEVSSSPEQAWRALGQALTSLGIKAAEKNAAGYLWLTDWVVWKYNSKTGTGRSRPGFSIASNSFERHQFLFAVKAGADAGITTIVATDKVRQEEVDIAPDSSYAWLEWQERPVQQEAAASFLRRLQFPIETALTARFIAPRETTNPLDAVVPESMPGQTVVTTHIPEENIPIIVPATAQATKAVVAIAPRRPPAVTHEAPVPDKSDPRPVVANSAVVEDVRPTNPASAAGKKGLLVNAPPSVAWPALTRALDDLDVHWESASGQPHTLITDPIDSLYHEKNQSLDLQSKQGPVWGFSLFGHGVERHVFKLMLLPVVDGKQSIIYAWHTVFQELTDQTPDSSQSLLIWVDHEPRDEIAVALLHKLRLVIPR